jgi:indoleamine 2,3-dioxygenase
MRWWLKSWESGCEFRGQETETKTLSGPSAIQTPIVHLIDAFLGVEHPANEALTKAQTYMKPGHRSFIAAVKNFNLREKMTASDDITETYNQCVENLHLFRRTHFGLAYDFVMVPSGMNNSRGTGGSPIAAFLKKMDQETVNTTVN